MQYHICPNTGDPCYNKPTHTITEKGLDGTWSSGHLCDACARQYMDRIEAYCQRVREERKQRECEPARVEFVDEVILAEKEKLQDVGRHGVVKKYLLALIEFLNSRSPKKIRLQKTPCPECGTTIEFILENTRAGCYHCYTHFREELATFLCLPNDTPGTTVRIDEETSVNLLQRVMTAAVKKEDYETAARVRDRLKELSLPKPTQCS